MTGYREAWGAALVIAVMGALLWLIIPIGSPSERTDDRIIVVHGGPSTAALSGAGSTGLVARSAPNEATHIPIVATDAEARLADAQSYLVANEKRDRAWADRSEAAIGSLMRDIAYVGRGKRLDITCAASACEVSGRVDADPATRSFTPVWEALERDTAGGQLHKFGLERTAALFDTGRDPDGFEIFYRRVDPRPPQDKEHFEWHH